MIYNYGDCGNYEDCKTVTHIVEGTALVLGTMKKRRFMFFPDRREGRIQVKVADLLVELSENCCKFVKK